MSETETRETGEELEEIIVTIQLPLKVISFLNGFCKFADTTIEELLKEELEQVVKAFYQGGFFEKWIQKAFKKREVSEYFQFKRWEKMSKTETIEVTLKVPKGIMQFLNDIIPSTNYDSLHEYLEDAIISRVQADIEGDMFNPTLKAVAERYGLKEEFDIKD